MSNWLPGGCSCTHSHSRRIECFFDDDGRRGADSLLFDEIRWRSTLRARRWHASIPRWRMRRRASRAEASVEDRRRDTARRVNAAGAKVGQHAFPWLNGQASFREFRTRCELRFDDIRLTTSLLKTMLHPVYVWQDLLGSCDLPSRRSSPVHH